MATHALPSPQNMYVVIRVFLGGVNACNKNIVTLYNFFAVSYVNSYSHYRKKKLHNMAIFFTRVYRKKNYTT